MKKISYLLALPAVLLFSSFVVTFDVNKSSLIAQPTGELKELNQTIGLGKAKFVKTLINIKGGKLIITDETKELTDVSFDYYDEYWSPNVSYTENSNEGRLVIKSNTIKQHVDKIKDNNICRIALNKKLHYALGVELGAGVADINLENYNIERALLRLGVGSFNVNLANTSIPLLKVEAGIGEATFDLSGERKNNLTANVNAGIGEISFIVPENVGVRFKINGFLGDVDAHGFTKDGKTYVNEAYEKSDIKMEFDVSGAIGSINITQK